MRLEELLVKKIVVLDGACGTQLIAKGKQGCLELLNIDEPAVVESLHEEYLEAGADIITTNTTCADSLCLAEYGLQERSYEIVRAGAELARRMADKYSTTLNPRFVAGSVGPTTRNLTLAEDSAVEAVAAAYEVQIRALIEGGVDMILIETVMDARNAALAVEQCRKIDKEIPIILSAVPSRIEGRVASGATIAKFLENIPMEEVLAVGFNCSRGVQAMAVSLKMLAESCDKAVVAYPAAESPSEQINRYAKNMEQLCRAGVVNIIGGCCGTTPEHTRLMAKMAARWRPRKIKAKK